MLVSLKRAKEHLRVDFNDDDAVISAYVGAAIDMVTGHIDRPVFASAAVIPPLGAVGYDPHAMVMSRVIEVAVLQLVDGLYHGTLTAGRDGAGTLPDPTAAVLAHLRVWRPEVGHGAT